MSKKTDEPNGAKVEISIIMPAFNAQKYLAASIQTAQQQTFENWELIVVNDGSTERTAEIAREFAHADKRIHVVSRANGGQGAARNTGLQHSRGEWIAFLDADDLWMPRKLELQLAAAREHGADLVCSNGAIFWDESLGNEAQIEQPNYPTFTGVLSGSELINRLFIANPIQNSSVLARRSSIALAGDFDESRSIQNCEDYDLWFRMARSGARFYSVSEHLFRYRRHADSTTYNIVPLHTPEIEVLKRYWPDTTLPHSLIKKRFRRVYRGLVKGLIAQGKFREARRRLDEMGRQWDSWGPLTLYQRVLMRLAPRHFNALIQPIYNLGDALKLGQNSIRSFLR